VASVPALPGCHTQARSLDELSERIKEAIGLYLESGRRDQRSAGLRRDPASHHCIMSQLPALTGKEVAVALGKAGFSVIRSRSIHHFMRHPDSRTTVAPCCVRVNSWWAANDEFSGKVHGLGETMERRKCRIQRV